MALSSVVVSRFIVLDTFDEENLSLREILSLFGNSSVLGHEGVGDFSDSLSHPDCNVSTLDLSHFVFFNGVHSIAEILLSSNVENLILSDICERVDSENAYPVTDPKHFGFGFNNSQMRSHTQN